MAGHVTPGAERTALYRLYDADGKLLYIGISNNPEHRFGQHRRNKPWWPQVERSEVIWLQSLAEAERAERDAIGSEGPRFNVSIRALRISGRAPSQKRTSYKDIAADLRRAILEGQYPPGTRVPGLNELRRRYSAAESTVRQALAVLKSEQLIYSRQGSGVFVRDLDENRTVAIAVDRPEEAADMLAKYMSPSNLAALADALAKHAPHRPR